MSKVRHTALVRTLTTTDHKVIGNLYFATTFFFFMVGGLMALLVAVWRWHQAEGATSESMGEAPTPPMPRLKR